jgi:putative SOS response-associated peptidase YedK
MCGRYALSIDIAELEEFFGAEIGVEMQPRYNIAPSQQVLAVRSVDGGGREGFLPRWGLIPSWAKDPAIGNRLLNARSETAAEKPSFRHAMKKRRCLIPADGFYEWKKEGKTKQPFFIRFKNLQPMAFAGLWERWEPPQGEPVDSCSILTTSPNELMAPIHDRMPVILSPDSFPLWLDPTILDPAQLQPLFKPYPAGEMTAYPVSSQVGSPKNQGKGLIEPMDTQAPPFN